MKKLSSVLLVDDDPLTNVLNERLLQDLHVAEHYRSARDGQEALTILDELSTAATPLNPVLVLLDVQMPGMDGMTFLEACHQRLSPAQQRAVVIVLHTASMQSQDLKRIEELPVAGLVSKPLTKEKMDTILKLHYQRQFPAA